MNLRAHRLDECSEPLLPTATVPLAAPHLLLVAELGLQLLHSHTQLGVILLLLTGFLTLRFQLGDLGGGQKKLC